MLTGATRRSSRIGVAVGIVSLLLVVAVASGAARPNGTGVALNSAWLLDAAAAIGAVALLATLGALVFAFWPARRQRQRRSMPKRSSIPFLVRTMVGLVWMAVMALVVAFVVHPRPRQLGGTRVASSTGTPRAGRNAASSAGASVAFNWWVVVGAVGVAGVVACVLWLRWRHRPLAEAETETAPSGAFERSDALNAVDESIAALEAEEDNRRAVISAYTGMQRSFARAGHPVAVWEAPFEYLSRVVPALGGTATPGARLTGLFERARFSDAEVGPDMKRSAIEALLRLRQELAE